MAEMSDDLAGLVEDEEFQIRQAATKSLLSFSRKNEAIGCIFRANIDHDAFRPLFLIAMAREHPALYKRKC